MGNGTHEIMENPLNNLPMSCGWKVHELASFIDRKTDVRLSDGTVL